MVVEDREVLSAFIVAEVVIKVPNVQRNGRQELVAQVVVVGHPLRVSIVDKLVITRTSAQTHRKEGLVWRPVVAVIPNHPLLDHPLKSPKIQVNNPFV